MSAMAALLSRWWRAERRRHDADPTALHPVLLALPWLWLLVFLAVPVLILANVSVSEMGDVRPMDLIQVEGGRATLSLSLDGYELMLGDPLYLKVLLQSLAYAAAATVLCLVIGYPFAAALAFHPGPWRPVLLMLAVLPFWTAMLLRLVAWKGLLAPGGWVAQALAATQLDRLLLAVGAIEQPGQLLHTPFSLLLGMTYTYLPFMVLPLYAQLVRQDPRLIEAARDLGARPWTAFWTVTVPQSRPAIVAGSLLVFIPSVGEFVIPEMLGGARTLMIGRVMWDELFANNDWPTASALAVVMLLLLLLPMWLFHRTTAARGARR